ncbi:hypothetical protein LX32DRAFT_413191 [Colletotrichum zoysiae]|uniref:Uncharacterized protein n=1 Tax=Colletotrichum zoysiae TaxID=1216348 RepID=A0AAD9HFR1_9PEZI|nr:hypothetical protein LX32DRAFT_413191 [Colletotrichum zoysiae]
MLCGFLVCPLLATYYTPEKRGRASTGGDAPGCQAPVICIPHRGSNQACHAWMRSKHTRQTRTCRVVWGTRRSTRHASSDSTMRGSLLIWKRTATGSSSRAAPQLAFMGRVARSRGKMWDAQSHPLHMTPGRFSGGSVCQAEAPRIHTRRA